MDCFLLFFKVIPLTIVGWWKVYARFFRGIFRFWVQKEPLDRIILLALLVQLGSSQIQVGYTIHFLNETEQVFVSTNINLWITFCCLIAIVLFIVSISIWIKYLLLSIEGMLGIVVILGLLNPKFIMVNFLNSNDFYFTYKVYVFAACVIISFVSILLSLITSKQKATSG